METLKLEEWQALAEQHRERLSVYAEGFRDRRSRGLKQPVEDFLFTYYHHTPSALLNWHPGWGRAIEIDQGVELPKHWRSAHYELSGELLQVSGSQISEKLRSRVSFIKTLLSNTAAQPALLGCYGLHEWAMVYRQEKQEIRHREYELRLSEDDLAAFIESQSLCCTHYDAFRFFTKEAVPRNAHQLSLDDRENREQPGCIHATMDLYKWAFKLIPFVRSELLAECFLLALKARSIDMRASPYDLADLGYEPIKIEQTEGRAQYQKYQQELMEEAAPLRAQLIELCADLLLRSGLQPVALCAK